MQFSLSLKHWLKHRAALPATNPAISERQVFCHLAGFKYRGRYFPSSRLTYRPCAYALIFDEAERLLMVASKKLTVRWNLPGGGLNRGETLQAGLCREILEETGLLAEVGPLVAITNDYVVMATGQPVQSLRRFYLARAVGGTLRPDGNGFDSDTVRYLDMHLTRDDEMDAPEEVRPAVATALTLYRALYRDRKI